MTDSTSVRAHTRRAAPLNPSHLPRAAVRRLMRIVARLGQWRERTLGTIPGPGADPALVAIVEGCEGALRGVAGKVKGKRVKREKAEKGKARLSKGE